MIGIILFPLRALVFIVGFIAYWMEIGSDWIIGARGKTEYVRKGSCKRCGRCCRLLALIMPEGVSKHSWIVKLISLWHRLAMNFHYVSDEDGWLVYRCGYYRERGHGMPGYCSIYPFRHRLCRLFPRQRLYGRPELSNDCGFKFVRRDVMDRKDKAHDSGTVIFEDVMKGKWKEMREDAKKRYGVKTDGFEYLGCDRVEAMDKRAGYNDDSGRPV